MNKIPCAYKNTEIKTLPVDVCVFGQFGQLSPAAVHSADCRFDSGVKWWIHVSSIVTYLRKNSFLLHENSCKQHSESSIHCCFWLTVSKCGTHFNTAFSLTKVHAKWWIPCLLISWTSLLSHATSIYDRAKWVCGVFWCFLGQLSNLGNLNI